MAWKPELPGAVAYFTSRRGGVSPPPWESLNLGLHVQDDPERVRINRERVTAGLGLPPNPWVTAEQVHGARVGVVDGAESDGGRVLPATDALITAARGVTLALFFADCVPLFFAGPGAVGLAHAGWRGTLSGIAVSTLEALRQRFGIEPSEVWVGIGPAIGPCCYEVSEELWNEFNRRLGTGVSPGPRYLDLAAANRELLLRAGVAPDRIVEARLCTRCRADLFFSHRRAGFPTGRMAALIYRP